MEDMEKRNSGMMEYWKNGKSEEVEESKGLRVEEWNSGKIKQ